MASEVLNNVEEYTQGGCHHVCRLVNTVVDERCEHCGSQKVDKFFIVDQGWAWFSEQLVDDFEEILLQLDVVNVAGPK